MTYLHIAEHFAAVQKVLALNVHIPPLPCLHGALLKLCDSEVMVQARCEPKTHKDTHTHAETHAKAQVCTQRAALSQQFSRNEALYPGQSLQMHIYSES